MQRGVSGLWWSGRFSVRRRTRPISSTVNVVKLAVTAGSTPGLEEGLDDLAALVPRERVDHGNPAGHLVVGQSCQEEGAQVVGGRVVAQHHPRRDVLAQDGVRDARHGGLDHGGMLEEGGLHLAGHHVVAAPDDDLLLAADDPEVAVAVDVAEVPALQPSVDPAVVGARLLVARGRTGRGASRRSCTSPTSPGGQRCCRPGPMMRISTPGSGSPTDPRCRPRSPIGMAVTAPNSVIP